MMRRRLAQRQARPRDDRDTIIADLLAYER